MGGGGVLRADAKRDEEERFRLFLWAREEEFLDGLLEARRREAGVKGVMPPQYTLLWLSYQSPFIVDEAAAA